MDQVTHQFRLRRFSGKARSVLRHGALSALGAWHELTDAFAGVAQRPLVQVLLLHRLEASEEQAMRGLLDRLSRVYTFISYSDAIDRIHTGQIDRAYLTVTFDDGLKNCLRAGRVLSEYGVRGCFFVCPGLVGERNQTRVSRFFRHRLLLPPGKLLDWHDVETMIDGGHEIGSHTMRHVNMREATIPQLQDELGTSREILQQRLGDVKHFAWPYGRFSHIAPAGVAEVFRAGYDSCASGERGCHAPHDDPAAEGVCIRRDNCQACWPVGHTLYFLTRSARRPMRPNAVWPNGWSDRIAGHAAATGTTADRDPVPRRHAA